MGIDEIIDELAAAQDAFVGTRFVAPVLPGGKVRVRIAQVVCELEIEGDPEPGLALLEALSPERARVIGPARRRQIAEYLGLFKRVRLLLLEQRGAIWYAIPSQGGTQPVPVDGVVPVVLVAGCGRFDAIVSRFDGARFIFEARDRRHERAAADYLRRAYEQGLAPRQLDRPGLTKQQREGFALLLWREALRERERAERRARREERRERRARESLEERLRDALAHAGGELHGFVEHADRYQVTWSVDGGRFTTAIEKSEQLSVMVAGICLSGQDRRFDLNSLVGVMREGQGPLVGVGGMAVEDYFEVHPPEEE